MQDIEYLKSLYPREVRILQGYVSEACDRMDYRNSPMYDEYPDQLMIDRICGTICETVEAAEWGERGKKTWDQSGEDREKLASSIDLDMKGNIVPESENGTEDKRQEDYGSTEEREPEYTSGDDYRESLVNPSGIQMEIQEMMAGEKGEESNPSQWSSAEMLFQNGADSELQQRPGSMSRLRDTEGFSAMEDRGSIYSPGPGSVRPPRPPYTPQPGPGPVRPPRPPYGPQPGPGPVRPPRPPYTPQPGPGPVHPPRPPYAPQPVPGPVHPPRPPYAPQPVPGPVRPPRPPYTPQPGPGPVRPPRPPYPSQPDPGPVRPPHPIFPSGSEPSWLRDLIQVLLLNEMYQRRCAAGRC